MKRIAWAMVVALMSAAATAAPFQNGSFEAGGPACNQFNIGAGTHFTAGWTVSVGNIDWESSPACGWTPSNGSFSLDLVGNSGIGGVSQTFNTTPGVTYTVSFDMAGNFGGPPTIKPLTVTVDGVTQNYTFDTTGATGADMGWTTHSFTFVATSTSATINFVSDIGSGNAGAALDNVSILPPGPGDAIIAVPIDGAGWLAAAMLALAGALALRRRPRR
jgi:choice-of-anchor C domain-containing protein